MRFEILFQKLKENNFERIKKLRGQGKRSKCIQKEAAVQISTWAWRKGNLSQGNVSNAAK